MNVALRSEYNEVLCKEHKGMFWYKHRHYTVNYIAVVVFSPSNETQKAMFDDYIQYFRSKDRAGVVPLKKMHLYLLPPCEQAFQIHKFGEDQILGVFVDENASNTAFASELSTNDLFFS